MDSIGTKPIVARERGPLRNCGADMAAHCINDVLTTGAEPLFLLDYVAANRLDLEQVAELVEGAAEVCRAAGCALIGGETAEMPGVYREGELDFAATCVGIVDRDELIDGSRVEAGDVVVGFPSAGRARERLHARPAACSTWRTTTATTCSRRRGSTSTTSARSARDADVRALAHVTGGGIDGNLVARAPGRAAGARSTGTRGSGRPCSRWLARHVDEDELRRVFNLGIGYCAVVPDPADGS